MQISFAEIFDFQGEISMISRKITVAMSDGTQMSPIALLVQTAGKYDSNIRLIKGNKTINAKSVMGTMAMGIMNGDTLEITAEGADEEKAVEALAEFLTK